MLVQGQICQQTEVRIQPVLHSCRPLSVLVPACWFLLWLPPSASFHLLLFPPYGGNSPVPQAPQTPALGPHSQVHPTPSPEPRLLTGVPWGWSLRASVPALPLPSAHRPLGPSPHPGAHIWSKRSVFLTVNCLPPCRLASSQVSASGALSLVGFRDGWRCRLLPPPSV